jgi:anti-sigma B factor antagonist
MTSASLQNGASLRLEGEMTIYKAVELKPCLLKPIQPDSALEIDLSGVTELDSAGVQLLMLARKTAQAMQCNLLITGRSPAVSDVFELLDLDAYFDNPLIIPPPPSNTGRQSNDS